MTRSGRRPALPAMFAVLVLVIGHLASLAHEASTRHITCSEHGEELETAALAESVHACDDTHLVGLEGDRGYDHSDCAILQLAHQSGAAVASFAHAHALAELLAPAPAVVVHATVPRGLYRLAPKTSPPA